LFWAGCDGCNANNGHGSTAGTNGGGGHDMSIGDAAAPIPVGDLYVTPAVATLAITFGGPAATQNFAAMIKAKSGKDDDVTQLSTFTLGDMTLGSMNGGLFTTSGAHGGTTTLTATYMGMTATATINVTVTGTFTTPSCQSCGAFPTNPAPSCAPTVAAPTLVYPPDGVLLPPNMETFAIHYLPAAGATLYEVDFQNAATDVRIVDNCATQPMDSRGMPSGGCVLDLVPTTWDFIAKSNRGGDPVKVTVRSTPDGMCVASGMAIANISFAEEDVTGGIYYWKSTISANGTGGQIWRKEFGDGTPEEQITGMGNIAGTCFGCHFLSRDGKRMTVNGDDDDSDDEYSDVNSGLIDVASKMFITTGTSRAGAGMIQPPGFQTFSPDHTIYLGTDGEASGPAPNSFYSWNGDTGNMNTPANIIGAAMNQRVTQPDWSADNTSLVYVVPSLIPTYAGANTSMHKDDSHVIGGSLYTMSISGTNFGTPTPLIQSQGENNYYPGYSPDGAFIVFNRVPQQPGTAPADNDSFSNPKAKVYVVPAKSTNPIECTALNTASDVSNSWPRWSPFIQMYKGNKLLWLTFSSTRDYGVLVHNNSMGLVQCYPPDSYEDPAGSHHGTFPANCKQPQIWMAAINLSSAEFTTQDPSWPAFWLPFQDMTTHNHTAQWTTTVVNTPTPDGGTCIAAGGDCTKDPNGCCAGICTGAGVCGVP
jgi:hypothetical protein